ncbi:MAG: 3-hydroxyacyl-CoA dehydrogenase NAD-binding domain-containing protein, partial [Flavobacteriales bacterium]|nr:3-hydroxyacyl-CoA dehydrogenase NAD-binding domain-containing protein [Flavobacteriales bacterium]
MKRNIRKVAVLGSGIMGSGIACQLANVGIEVLLLDIVPKEFEKSDSKSKRDSIVNNALKASLKSKPSPIYVQSFSKRITTGNFTDDMHKIADCDWIIEVVVERLDIKKIIFDQVDKFRKEGSLVSSNTSGIPIALMLEDKSDDFKANFLGTHFFNPPRYLKLLEIIPTKFTNADNTAFMMNFGEKILGKTTVLCKDTPAFIANRVGVYAIQQLFHLVNELDLSVSEVDFLTGPIMGRPKSATFRTCDVVGLDTLVHVANGLKDNCKEDEKHDVFYIPDFIDKMVEKNMLGSKTKQGFYKKSVDEKGKKTILELNLKTFEYQATSRYKYPTISKAKQTDDIKKRMKILFEGNDKAGNFYQKVFSGLFSYAACRIPEIADEIYKIDDAMKAGFGWELGPFEMWNEVGIENGIKIMENNNLVIPDWVSTLSKVGINAFYKNENGKKLFYDINTSDYKEIPGSNQYLQLDSLDKDATIWKNDEASLIDLGDGILNVAFHSKMNTIGGGILAALNKGLDLAEQGEFKGLVIANEGANFSAGANVGMIFMMAAEQDYDELNMAVKAFQNTTMRLRYSSIPVVAAPHGMTLGGGCEICLHADKVIAHAETYMGLVEFGVGLIPGGGGTKEMALRFSDEIKQGDMRINRFRDKFLTVGQAKVSTSGHEAFELGFLRTGIDEVIVSKAHQIAYAKKACIQLASKGYNQPAPRKDIKVLGNEGLGIVYVGADSMLSGNYMSEHDLKISEKLGYVLCGGDLSEITEVSEKYLLDLERKAFVELCAERKTLERI